MDALLHFCIFSINVALALATNGKLVYHGPGGQHVLVNPPNDICIQLEHWADRVDIVSDMVVEFFTSLVCLGFAFWVLLRAWISSFFNVKFGGGSRGPRRMSCFLQ